MSDESGSDSSSDSDSNDPRAKWEVGSLVQVYSISSKEWKNGEITKIKISDGIEWLKVRYRKGDTWSTKKVRRYEEGLIRNRVFSKQKRKSKILQIIHTTQEDMTTAKESTEIPENEPMILNEPSHGHLKNSLSSVLQGADADTLRRELERRHTETNEEKKKNTKTNEPGIKKYVGQVMSTNKEYSYGTGTMFHYDEEMDNVYVITSGHIVQGFDDKDNIYFQKDDRRKCQCKIVEIHENYYSKSETKEEVKNDLTNQSKAYLREKEKHLYDLAVLIFEDTNRDYIDIFDKNEVEISSTDDIPSQFILKFEIHGHNHHKGGLVTFQGYNFDEDEKKGNIIDINDNKEFSYPNIDIKDGLDGAVIAQPYDDGKYGIVGIHTTKKKGVTTKKKGVILNDAKCEWIKSIKEKYQNQ